METTTVQLPQKSFVHILVMLILSLSNLSSLGAVPYEQLDNLQAEINEYTENFQSQTAKDFTEHAEWDIHNHTLSIEQKDGVVQFMPTITGDGFGEYYVTWVDFRNEGDPQIFAQKMDGNGNRLWPNDLQIVTNSGAYYPMPKVKTGIDRQGNLVILWWGEGNLQMQKVDRSGNQLLSENGQIIKTSVAADWWNTTYSFAIDDEGSFFLAKSNYYLTDSKHHITLEKFSVSGDRVWTQPVLIWSGDGDGDPSLVWDNSGNLIIVWRDRFLQSQYINWGMFTHILAQKVDTNGQAVWSQPIQVVETPNGDGYSVIQDNDNTYIAWSDYAEMDPSHPNMNSYGIYAQKLNGQGNRLWPSRGVKITHQFYGDSNPSMNVDAHGNLLLSWHSGNYTGGDIFLQKITPNGLMYWSQDVIVSVEKDKRDRKSPGIALGIDGSIFVTWADREVYFQKFDANGSRLFKSDIRVNEVFGTANQDQPVLGIGGGNTYIAWVDDRDDHPNVYVQRLAEDGSSLWDADIRVNSKNSNKTRYLRIFVGSDGCAVIAWYQESYDPPYHQGIFLQKVDAQGNRLWKNEVELSVFNGDFDMQMALDQSDNIYIFWSNNYVFDIESAVVYGLIISPQGQKLSSSPKIVISGSTGKYIRAVAVTYDLLGNLLVGCIQQVPSTNSTSLLVQRLDLVLSSVWQQTTEFATTNVVAHLYLDFDSQGNTIIFWANFGVNVEAQKIDPNGNVLWQTPHVFLGGEGSNLAKAWVDSEDNLWFTYGWDGVYLQKFTQSGQHAWYSPVRVSQDWELANIHNVSVAVDDQDKTWISWSVSMAVNIGNSDSDIFIQTVDSQGNIQWPDPIKMIDPEQFYNLLGSAQSRNINATGNKIHSAILTSEFESNGGSVRFFLSNDGGSNWVEVIPGIKHIFNVFQSDLRWKVDLHKDPIWPRTPAISSIHIEYSSLVPGSDDYEPDDPCEQAQPIETLGVPQQHTFHATNDADWVWFTTDAGTEYTVQTASIDDVADTMIDLYTDCSGEPIAQDDNPLGMDSRITWSASQSGLIYVRVRSASEFDDGRYPQYLLSVRADHPAPVAVIVVGETTNAYEQAALNAVGDQAYQTFLSTGMSKGSIRYFGPDTQRDSDGNGQSDDVFGKPIKNDLKDAIQDWSREQGVRLGMPFYLIIVSPGKTGQLYISDNEGTVTASDLSHWLDNLEATSGADQINVIIEAPKSGSFIQPTEGGVSLSKDRRVVITSTSNTEDSYLYPQGSVFMTPFLSALGQHKDLKSAFYQAKEAVREIAQLQTPWIDANGDGQPDESDQYQLETVIPTVMSSAGSPNMAAYGRGLITNRPWLPVLDQPLVNTGENGKTVIQVHAYGEANIQQVWALIYPKGYPTPVDNENDLTWLDLTRIDLLPLGNDVYQATLDQVAPERLLFFATDASQNISIPLLFPKRSGQQIFLPFLTRE